MKEEPSMTKGRFEVEHENQTSFLAYELDGKGWISLLHTQVPKDLRGRGIANELAQIGLEYAKKNNLKVDVVCPIVFHYLNTHPEYKPLVGIRPRDFEVPRVAASAEEIRKPSEVEPQKRGEIISGSSRLRT